METNDNMDIKNREHIKETYVNKSLTLLRICIGISIFSGLTYLYGLLIYNAFDFGLIFEIISFLFIILAFNAIKKNDFISSKRNIIIAMIPIGWLIIYDLINLLVNIHEVLVEVGFYYMSFDRYFYYIEPYLFDITLVSSIILLYKAYSSLCIADGSKKSTNFTDTFYDSL